MSRLQKDQGLKEDAMGEYVGMQAIRNDLSRLESMTVKELRTMSRSVGISTRGTKKDLILALKRVAVDNEDATAGQCSLSAGNDISSAIKTIESQDMPSKRKAISPSSEDDAEDHSAFSEVSEKKQKRTRRKQQPATVIKGASRTVVQQKKQSIEIEVSETQGSRLSERVSSRVKSTEKVVNQMKVESGEPWTMLVHKKPQDGWIPYNPKTMRPPPLSRDTKSVKLMSWNVNGLRALLKLESFSALQLAQKEDFDVLCLQETKIQEKDVEEIKERLIDGYDNSYWTCSVSKLGYSGTAIISRIKPVSVKYGLGVLDHDSEGRLVTAEFDTFYLLCGYVPNSGDGLRRLTYRVEEWDRSLSDYMKELEKSKPVILTGDLNCAHQEIDIFNPAGNRRSAGFTDEERQSFERNFLSKGFMDTFRRQHPDVVGYTYWGYRHGGRKTNKGWRLDYFLASESIADTVHDSYILPEVTGSDHCPIGLILKL